MEVKGIIRIPPDAYASPNGTFKKMDCPRLIYHVQEKRWEVEGGTEEENKILNSKYDPNFKIPENAVRVDVPDWQDVYRECVDGRLIGDMPKNCYYDYSDKKTYPIVIENQDVISRYYSGDASLDDVQTAFENSFYNMQSILMERCQTSGSNPGDQKKIIQDTLFEFRRDSIALATYACAKEGERFYGETEFAHGAYYNSDYANMSADLIRMVEQCAVALGEEVGSEPIKVDAWKSIDPATSYLYSTFNERWGWQNGITTYCSDITDPDVIPPKGFSFLFNRHKNPYLLINWKGDSQKISLSSNKWKGNNKLSEFFYCVNPSDEDDYALNKFLSNVRLYTYGGYLNTHRVSTLDMKI